MNQGIKINDTISLAPWELQEQFVRAQGAGGQHVNKVSSAVQLRFYASNSPSLSPSVKHRLRKLVGSKWTQDGDIVIECDEFRSQLRNREVVRERLADYIRQALVVPKRRIATRPTKASQRRRVEGKRIRAKVKSNRNKPGGHFED
ncbi:MAG: aminoacyl-tRNA hydrolase [Gammaproteobacteria bacterium]|nr:aminoacyl-tRNA hydrolase [Gammaproteobacteria bacterium]